MKITLKTPTKAYIEASQEKIEELRERFSFQDEKMLHQAKRLMEALRSHLSGRFNYQIKAMGVEAAQDEIERLRLESRRTAVHEDKDGYWIYSGLVHQLDPESVKYEFEIPGPNPMSWNGLKHTPRHYQNEAKTNLIKTRHASVSIGTGLGKSTIIAQVIQELGQPTLIMAPFLNVAKQLYQDLVDLFGPKRVGMYFGNKKQSDKMIVVSVCKSLTLVKEGTRDFENLASKKVLISDESHTTPAETLSKVVFGLCQDIPYRFFFSGTQIRQDGLQVLLEGIIGPIVYTMSVKEGVDQGFLAQPRFRIFETDSPKQPKTKDAIKINREFYQENSLVIGHAAYLANSAVDKGKRVVILIDQFSQFELLYKKLKHSFKFAHGGADKNNKSRIPEEFWKSDPSLFVKEFDKGLFPILIGTSCIGTGTDIKTTDFIIDLVGGKSEVRLCQNVGRGTRKPPGKTTCTYVTYNIKNIPVLNNQGKARKKILKSIYPDIKVLDI